jgi:hypothetical protein
MPGLCQLVTGMILFIGLTWFHVFAGRPLYMAAVAFSAYGIHWFALGWNRYRGNDPGPTSAWLSRSSCCPWWARSCSSRPASGT